MAFQTVLYPKISNWDAQGQMVKIGNSLARAFTYSLFLAIPTCVGGWILGDRLLYYLYGASFIGGTSALYFLLLAQVVNVFMFLGTMSLNALDRPKDAFWITVLAACLNIVLDLALIPLLGITGAAIATLTAMTVNALGALIFLRRIISVKFEYRSIKNMFYAAGCMAVFLLFIHFLLPPTHIAAVLGVVITGAGVYIGVLFKIDREIHDELKNLIVSLGMPLPGFLLKFL
jgi:O-antigen/teichoic acid export membrane protein